MSMPETSGMRRQRLLAEMQGQPIDEAYRLNPIRSDLEAEAAEAGPDALVTPAMLELLRELTVKKHTARRPAPRGTVQPELFCSTDKVVIVPGFMASALRDRRHEGLGLIWLSPGAVLKNLLGSLQLGPYDGSEADLDPRVRVAPVGALPIFYDLLRLALEVRRYSTEIFAVDWRKDLEIASRRLAARLRRLAREGCPVHLVAHSQGAMIARRAVQCLKPEEARRTLRHLILLGPANYGTFSAVLALGGGHSMLPLARRLCYEPPQGFQRVLASMSGLYQLMPWDRERVPWLIENDLGRSDFWRTEIDPHRLERFYGWGRLIDTGFFNDRTSIVMGDNYGSPTTGGVIRESPVLCVSPPHNMSGDGTVPHACSVLPGVPTFLAPNTEHMMLATNRGVIEAVLDILASRAVCLPSTSSSPADHLPPTRATQSELTSTPALPAPRTDLLSPGKLIAASAPAALRSGPRQNQLLPPASSLPRSFNGQFLTPCACNQVQSICGWAIPPLAMPMAVRRDSQCRTTLNDRVLQSSVVPDPRWPTAVHELILDASELLPFDFLRTGDRLGRAVVKIQCEDGAVGTGFLVAPGILLTNNHVLPDVRTATGSYALANYESYPTSDALGRPAVAPLDPTVLFISNPDLDFTFCGVQGLDFLGTIPIDRNSSHISLLEYVNIIQHPRGRPKEVALQDNRVVKADNVVLHYACDTEPGSSGSPVFNNRWRLVALHHASVITDSPEGRFAANADPSSRYLNEGIRLSAIATWLETAEANTIERREQAKRLRSVFSGLDPQIGFFGALGRKACGKTAAEIVTDSYQGDADDVDIAFWSLGRLGRRFAEHLADVGRVVAELRLDLWCLTHAHPASVRALCEHLETNYQLAYEFLIDSADTQPYSAVIFKHSRTLAVEQIAWQANEHMSTARVPMHVLVRATTRSGDIVEFHLVPIPDEIPPEQGDNSTESTRLLVEAVGREIPKSRSTADWILIGDTGALLALQDVSALIQTGYELVTAAAERDGALAFLAGPASCVDQIFISPNLNPAIGRPECLVVTRDRTLPQSITSLTHPHPIAFRLALNGAAQKEQAAGAPRAVPAPLTHPPGGRDPQRQPEPTGLVTDADFEQRLRDMLMPMIAKIVAETRQQASGGKLS